MESQCNKLSLESDHINGLIGECLDNVVIIKLSDNPLFIGELKPGVDKLQALRDTMDSVENDIMRIILSRMLSGLMDNQDMNSIPDGLYPFDMNSN